MLTLVLLALIALSMGALMLSDGLLVRGLVAMAAASGPAFLLRAMHRDRSPAQLRHRSRGSRHRP